MRPPTMARQCCGPTTGHTSMSTTVGPRAHRLKGGREGEWVRTDWALAACRPSKCSNNAPYLSTDDDCRQDAEPVVTTCRV